MMLCRAQRTIVARSYGHRLQSAISQSSRAATMDKPPSRFGWRYHADNTLQFILWASFGSAAIHLLNIKQKFEEKDRKLSNKIALLKDVITRIGQGEDVDVEKELRVGHFEEEAEWQEIMDSFLRDAERDVPLEAGSVSTSQSVTGGSEEDLEKLLDELGRSESDNNRSTSRGWFKLS